MYKKIYELEITNVEQFYQYLKIYGSSHYQKLVKGLLTNYMSQCKDVLPSDQLEIGTIAVVKNSRVKIISIFPPNIILVQFIDYGNFRTVNIKEIFLINPLYSTERIEPQVFTFLLSGVNFNWISHRIEELSSELIGQNVQIKNILQFDNIVFARVLLKNIDYTEHLIKNRNLGNPTSEKMIPKFFESMNNNTSTFHRPFSSSDERESKDGTLPQTELVVYTAGQKRPYKQMSSAINMLSSIEVSSDITQTAYEVHNGINSNQLQHKDGLEIQIINGSSSISNHELSSQNVLATINISEAEQPKHSVMTFKSRTLKAGSYYDVTVCYVENGPCLFSVHLNSTLEDLDKITLKLGNYQLVNLKEKPSLGMACIAKFSEDGQLYRAVIIKIKPTTCRVVYVDYGNTEYVSFNDIYEIPSEFLEQESFAIQFALFGYGESEAIDDYVKTAFENSVLCKNFRLKVVPPFEGSSLVQHCKLYDKEMRVLKFIETNYKYCSPETLTTGDMVVIRYVESPKKFFVQKVKNIEIFDKMMDNLFLYCTKSKVSVASLEQGSACAVKFENAWYRAQLLSLDKDFALVKHVDFGNERRVKLNQLSVINEEFTKLPPQAIMCCLNGFEDTEILSELPIIQLEMLAEGSNHDRRHFKCQIFEIQENNTLLVNLIDDTMKPELNLMEKLYQLSMPFDNYIELEKEEYII